MLLQLLSIFLLPLQEPQSLQQRGLEMQGEGTVSQARCRPLTALPVSRPSSALQVKGTLGFMQKDLESLSSTRLEARLPYHDSRAMTSSP